MAIGNEIVAISKFLDSYNQLFTIGWFSGMIE